MSDGGVPKETERAGSRGKIREDVLRIKSDMSSLSIDVTKETDSSSEDRSKTREMNLKSQKTSSSSPPRPPEAATKEGKAVVVKKGKEEPEEEEDPKTVVEWIARASIILADIKGNWRDRSKALKQLQTLATTEASLVHADETQRECIVSLLKTQLRDLRSAVIREACKTIQCISDTEKERFSASASELLPTLMDQSACGNKVISTYALRAMLDVIRSAKPKGVVETCAKYLDSSKNWKVRCNSVSAVSIVVSRYENAKSDDLLLRKVMLTAQADAHAKVREEARKCFRCYRERFPDCAKQFLASADKRAVQRLS